MKQAGIEPMNHERGFGMTYGLGSREHGLWLKNDWRISTIFGCSDMVDIAKLHKQLWDGDLWWPGSKLSTSKMITYHHSNWCGWIGARSLPGFPAIGGWLHTTPVVDPQRDLIQMQLMLGDWAPSTRWQQICCKQPEMARCYGGRRRFRFWNHWKNAPTGDFQIDPLTEFKWRAQSSQYVEGSLMALVWQRNLHQNMPEFIESSFWLVIKFLQRMNLMVGPSLKPLTGMVFPIVSFEVLGKFTKEKIENSLTNLGLPPRLIYWFSGGFFRSQCQIPWIPGGTSGTTAPTGVTGATAGNQERWVWWGRCLMFFVKVIDEVTSCQRPKRDVVKMLPMELNNPSFCENRSWYELIWS